MHAAGVLAPGAHLDESVLRKEVLAELGLLYEPHRIDFMPELPRTPVGKIDGQAIRAMQSERLV